MHKLSLKFYTKEQAPPNSVGRTFSEEEIGQTFIQCMAYFDPHPPPVGTEPGKRTDKKQGKTKGKGKAKKGKAKGAKAQPIAEHHGVMFMYKKEFEKFRIWFKQITGRLIQICLKTKGPNLVITNTLAPHAWVSGDRSKDDMLEI